MNMKGEERVELQLLASDEAAPVQVVRVESIFTGEVRGCVRARLRGLSRAPDENCVRCARGCSIDMVAVRLGVI